MTSGSNAVVEAHGLRKTYKPDIRALDGLSFEVAAGSVFALLGPNGAGKTTTVRILTTLSRPDEGTATVAGHRCTQQAWPGPVGYGLGEPAHGRHRAAHRPGEPDHAGQAVRDARQGLAPQGQRSARSVRPRRSGETAGSYVLGRHATAAGHRLRPRPPARGPV